MAVAHEKRAILRGLEGVWAKMERAHAVSATWREGQELRG